MSTTCSTVDCASNSLPPAGRGLQQCRHCFRTYCRGCMNAGDMRILEYRWLTPQAVCLKCFGRLSRIESTLHELAVLRGTWPCSDRTVQSPPPSPCCFRPFVHATTWLLRLPCRARCDRPGQQVGRPAAHPGQGMACLGRRLCWAGPHTWTLLRNCCVPVADAGSDGGPGGAGARGSGGARTGSGDARRRGNRRSWTRRPGQACGTSVSG